MSRMTATTGCYVVHCGQPTGLSRDRPASQPPAPTPRSQPIGAGQAGQPSMTPSPRSAWPQLAPIRAGQAGPHPITYLPQSLPLAGRPPLPDGPRPQAEKGNQGWVAANVAPFPGGRGPSPLTRGWWPTYRSPSPHSSSSQQALSLTPHPPAGRPCWRYSGKEEGGEAGNCAVAGH